MSCGHPYILGKIKVFLLLLQYMMMTLFLYFKFFFMFKYLLLLFSKKKCTSLEGSQVSSNNNCQSLISYHLSKLAYVQVINIYTQLNLKL